MVDLSSEENHTYTKEDEYGRQEGRQPRQDPPLGLTKHGDGGIDGAGERRRLAVALDQIQSKRLIVVPQ